jgi:flagellar hook-associated protein 1 FlgK
MGVSSFYGLQTSLRGLLAQQRALDTTGHNIANANTEGYSRQEAVMSASPALAIPAGAVETGAGAHLGSGVDVQTYRRIRDVFLDLQYRAQNKQLGYNSTRAEQLDRAELALAEPSENGISKQLTEFWNAWSSVGNNPSNAAARTNLVQQAKGLADAIATVDGQLETVAQQAQAEFSALTASRGEVHLIAEEIAQLNGIIKSFKTAGDIPNDLMDQRDLLLDKLSGLGALSVEAITDAEGNDTGSLQVRFANTSELLVDDEATTWPQVIPDSPEGKLGALRTIFEPGGAIETYRNDLDGFVSRLAETVNGLHAAGSNGTGGAFFTIGDTSSPAGSLQVLSDPSAIQTTASAGSGGGDLALRIAALRQGKTDASDPNVVSGLYAAGTNPNELYSAYVAKVGTDVREATTQEANAQSLTDAVEDRRQAVAGVSLDEEMSNLIRFQRGYQASSRAMSTMDDMLDVLINRTGRVGL